MPKSQLERTSPDAGASAGGQPKHHDEDDDPKRLYAKPAWVFNIDQVDSPAEVRGRLVPAAPLQIDLTKRLERVDAVVAAVGIEIREGGQRAFYRHKDSKGDGDFIQMPPRALFTGTATSTPTEAYYSTLLHEEIHGSGAAHRLNRQFGERFADKAYAFEELVAELGAAFLCAHLGMTSTPRIDYAQYCASWLQVLKDDDKAIFSAASFATRAVDYLLGFVPGNDPAPGTTRPDSATADTPATGVAPARPEDVLRRSAARGP